jgi:hypothetical protein
MLAVLWPLREFAAVVALLGAMIYGVVVLLRGLDAEDRA